MSKLFAWVILALCFYCGINWYVLPTFPSVAQYVSGLTIFSAIGLSGLIIAVSLCFGRD